MMMTIWWSKATRLLEFSRSRLALKEDLGHPVPAWKTWHLLRDRQTEELGILVVGWHICDIYYVHPPAVLVQQTIPRLFREKSGLASFLSELHKWTIPCDTYVTPPLGKTYQNIPYNPTLFYALHTIPYLCQATYHITPYHAILDRPTPHHIADRWLLQLCNVTDP